MFRKRPDRSFGRELASSEAAMTIHRARGSLSAEIIRRAGILSVERAAPWHAELEAGPA